ncbi:MAG: RluA family pseudouridine synthase [Candidatus Paceibacterota bacterium]|jgi:23S rRNA pseudouridine1911/1915/1917 synthase
MEEKIIFENEDIKVIDKPPGLNSDDIEGRVHRLDKDTSGILLVAKNKKALEFFQSQFKDKKVKKRYIALVTGHLKSDSGEIRTMLGRSPSDRRKQKVFFLNDPDADTKREAVTKYKVLKKFEKYDLIEVEPLSGRKHQIRAHFTYLGNPLAGDKLYGFKNQPAPEGLTRQFLHATYLKINFPEGEKEFQSDLPEDLKKVLEKLN